jgi:pimeloyl-ACP methyl ester carboxylesterase
MIRYAAVTFLLFIAVCEMAAQSPRLDADASQLGIRFDRYTVKDALERTITFYLSSVAPNDHDIRPIILWVQGSGAQSLFSRQGNVIAGGSQNLLRDEAKGRARILVVEKPGVAFLDVARRPGGAEGASEEFLREHTLERWGEANVAALRGAWTLPGIDSERTLVMGHSEGGIVVAWVAAHLPTVTHAASLAGGGPTQLFSFAELRARTQPGDSPGDAEGRRQTVYEEWAKIQRDPDSITQLWQGHPYRRWSSFLRHSVSELLLRSKAKIYLVQGTADMSVYPPSHDVLFAELKGRGRDVTAEKIIDGDHGFNLPDQPKGGAAGMRAVFPRVLAWFFGTAPKSE